MSNDFVTPSHEESSRPTAVRYSVLTVVTIMSVLLYVDRFAVAIASEYIREDLRMSQTQMAWFISAFFWAYALCQVPGGWFSDRFGSRKMLTVYIIAWSVFTGMMGDARSVWLMLWLRLLCGASQAGAYPTSAGLIRHWFPVSFRATASSIVGLGGRFGAVLAPIVTAWLIIFFLPKTVVPTISSHDLLDRQGFLARCDGAPVEKGKPGSNSIQLLWIEQFVSGFSEDNQRLLRDAAGLARGQQQQRISANRSAARVGIDLNDWLPSKTNVTTEIDTPELTMLIDQIALQMTNPLLATDAMIPAKLNERGRKLLAERSIRTLNDDESTWLNRYLLEGVFPAEIRKIQGPGWRPTMVLYGLIGVVVGGAYWWIARNTPQDHPRCNLSERLLIRPNEVSIATTNKSAPFPCRMIVTSASLWGNSMTQFLTNVGWFFVVSSLPRYLGEIHGVSLVMQGIMTAFPSGAGIVALFFGGRMTDRMLTRYGLKWGRRIPLVASRFAAAGGYATCLVLSLTTVAGTDKPWLPWLYLLGLCIAAFFTDFGTPAIWAYAQDVGGPYTSSILGWGNMWGNLGAAVSPLIYNWCLGETPSVDHWNLVFGVCCGAFILSGLTAMLLDATKPLTSAPVSLSPSTSGT